MRSAALLLLAICAAIPACRKSSGSGDVPPESAPAVSVAAPAPAPAGPPLKEDWERYNKLRLKVNLSAESLPVGLHRLEMTKPESGARKEIEEEMRQGYAEQAANVAELTPLQARLRASLSPELQAAFDQEDQLFRLVQEEMAKLMDLPDPAYVTEKKEPEPEEQPEGFRHRQSLMSKVPHQRLGDEDEKELREKEYLQTMADGKARIMEQIKDLMALRKRLAPDVNWSVKGVVPDAPPRKRAPPAPKSGP